MGTVYGIYPWESQGYPGWDIILVMGNLMGRLHTTSPEKLTNQELLLSTITVADFDRKHSGGWDKEWQT